MPTVYVNEDVYEKIKELSTLLKIKYRKSGEFSLGNTINWMYENLKNEIAELKKEIVGNA